MWGLLRKWSAVSSCKLLVANRVLAASSADWLQRRPLRRLLCSSASLSTLFHQPWRKCLQETFSLSCEELAEFESEFGDPFPADFDWSACQDRIGFLSSCGMSLYHLKELMLENPKVIIELDLKALQRRVESLREDSVPPEDFFHLLTLEEYVAQSPEVKATQEEGGALRKEELECGESEGGNRKQDRSEKSKVAGEVVRCTKLSSKNSLGPTATAAAVTADSRSSNTNSSNSSNSNISSSNSSNSNISSSNSSNSSSSRSSSSNSITGNSNSTCLSSFDFSILPSRTSHRIRSVRQPQPLLRSSMSPLSSSVHHRSAAPSSDTIIGSPPVFILEGAQDFWHALTPTGAYPPVPIFMTPRISFS